MSTKINPTLKLLIDYINKKDASERWKKNIIGLLTEKGNPNIWEYYKKEWNL